MTPSRPIGMETIILVDSKDKEIGTGEKLEVHQKGLLHRAFSVNIINRKGEFLLQQRAKIKYHSGGLWTNACCSHPHAGETLETAIHRRLKEEMGFDVEIIRPLKPMLVPKLGDPNTWVALIHYLAKRLGEIKPGPEIREWKWFDINNLPEDCAPNIKPVIEEYLNS